MQSLQLEAVPLPYRIHYQDWAVSMFEALTSHLSCSQMICKGTECTMVRKMDGSNRISVQGWCQGLSGAGWCQGLSISFHCQHYSCYRRQSDR